MALPPSPTRIYEACLVEAGKTLRTAQFYPLQHPAFQRSLERSWLYMSQLLKRVGKLEITITKTAPFVDGRQVAGNTQVLSFLAGECFRRRIKIIHVETTATQADLEALFSVLSREPRELVEAGGPEKELARAGARHLWTNTARFDAQMLADEEQPPEPLDDQTMDEIMGADAPDGHAELRMQLEALSRAPGAQETRRLLSEVVGHARIALETQDTSAALLAVSILARLIEAAGDDPGRVRAYGRAIAAVSTPAVVEALIGRLGRAPEASWQSWATPLQHVGAPAVPFLLAAMASSSSRKERLRTMAVVRSFSREARGAVLQLMQDGRWFVVRNALELLPDVGGPELTPAAQPFVTHGHARVRQSARQALRRFGGDEALAALVKATGDGPDEERRHAVSQLGFFPAAAVMPVVLDLIENGSPTVAEEALRVLGELEPPDLLTFLERLLRERGGLLGRRRRDALRRTAAELICLRLPDTWGILKQFADDPDAEIRKWVVRGVEWMKRARKREAQQA